MTLPAPSDPRTIRWRYHFTDFRSGVLLATLPMTGVTLGEVLSGVGSAKGTVPLSSLDVRQRDPFAATTPRRTCCWAERQVLDPSSGQVVESSTMWGGIVLSRNRSHGGRSMTLGMTSWAGYLARRLSRTYRGRNYDLFTVARDLVSWAVRQPVGAYGRPVTGHSPHHDPLIPTTGPLSGVLNTVVFLHSDLKPTLEALTQLADGDPGFDWRLVPYMETPGDLSTFRVRLDLGYPRLGRVQPADLRWSTDKRDSRSRWGYVSDLTIAEDGSGVNNRLWATGGGSTGEDLITVAVESSQTSRNETLSGYPVWETALQGASQDDKTSQQVIRRAMGAMLAGFSSEVQVSGIKVRGDLHPTVSSYAVGDDLTIKIGEQTTGQPTTLIGQLVGRTIEPAEQGSVERVSLDVQGSVTAVEPVTMKTRYVQRTRQES